MNDESKDPFHIPSEVESLLGAEFAKLPTRQFSRDEVIAMIERGEDVQKLTGGQWSLIRDFNHQLKYDPPNERAPGS